VAVRAEQFCEEFCQSGMRVLVETRVTFPKGAYADRSPVLVRVCTPCPRRFRVNGLRSYILRWLATPFSRASSNSRLDPKLLNRYENIRWSCSPPGLLCRSGTALASSEGLPLQP